jgi:small-conductance mechanosensitive channel
VEALFRKRRELLKNILKSSDDIEFLSQKIINEIILPFEKEITKLHKQNLDLIRQLDRAYAQLPLERNMFN